jgi:hypothetical protein
MTQTPVSTLQPALTLTEFLDTNGVFPPRDATGSGPFLGSVGLLPASPFCSTPLLMGGLWPTRSPPRAT